MDEIEKLRLFIIKSNDPDQGYLLTRTTARQVIIEIDRLRKLADLRVRKVLSKSKECQCQESLNG